MELNVTKKHDALGLRMRRGELKTSQGTRIEIGLSPVIVGRSPSCDCQVEGEDVSALHCEVMATPNGVLVRDLGSTNGTYLNGVLISEGVIHRPSVLQVGSVSLTLVPNIEEWVDVKAEQFGGLIGSSSAMRMVHAMLFEVAPTDLSVLLTGETGTGKEVAARSIHEGSQRKDSPLVVLDCTSVPGTLAESILFGHERGAFTGATERRTGVFQEANGGTLFLDEIGELPAELQPKLLRALAEKKVRRVGASQYESVDIRLIAATLRDLTQSINQGAFRQDVYFRLAQVRVRLPPLRSRLEDIPVLTAHFCKVLGFPQRTDEVVHFVRSRFESSQWPGNVRELFNVVQLVGSVPAGAAVLEQMLTTQRAPSPDQRMSNFVQSKAAVVTQFEQAYFEKLCLSAQNNVSEMARQSGLGRHQVRQYLRRYGLQAKDEG
jgi:transcriptional regulator with GAF, ATPase, and Fis domain